MIKPEDIPDEVAKAVTALFEPGYLESIGLHPESIAAAAINAWPRAGRGWRVSESVLALPLPEKEVSK